MRFTHLGHSCVLVETGQQRVLIDPGNFSDTWHSLTDLDAILVTHLHPDHIDPVHGPALVAANPRAQVYVEPSVMAAVPLPGATALTVDTEIDLGSVRVSAVGGWHAVIHRDIEQIGNIGLVLSERAGTTFFHPGDSLSTVPVGVDILAVPLFGPWAAMKETIDFVRTIGAPKGFPIHDALLSANGWNLIFGRVNAMTNTECVDLREKSGWDGDQS